MLASSSEVSNLTKNDFLKVNLAHNNKNVEKKGFSLDFGSFSDSLTRFNKAFQKEDLLRVSLGTFSRVNNFFFEKPLNLMEIAKLE